MIEERYIEIIIKWNNFLDSQVIDIDGENGDKVKGIFIPFNINGMYVTDKGSAWSRLILRERPKNSPIYGAGNIGGTHSLSLNVSREHWEKLTSMGLRVPYLGSARYKRWKLRNSLSSIENEYKRVKIDDDERV